MYETYGEVFRQGPALSKTYDCLIENKKALLEFVCEYGPDEILFVACGSSYWLSLSASLTMQRETGIRCSALKSGDVVLDSACYGKAFGRLLVVCPSRSGMTGETVIAARNLKKWYDAKVLVFTEAAEGRECALGEVGDLVIRQPWARERAKMQTQSFCSLYLSCIMLAAMLSDNKRLLEDIRWYIDAYDALAQKADQWAKTICEDEFRGYEYLVSLGSGCQYGLAVEAGYIQLEISRFRASYFATLEYRHGPYLANDEHTLFCLFSGGEEIAREEKVIGELKRDLGRVLAISGNTVFQKADWNFSLGRAAAPEIVALHGLMLMYGIAYYKALQRGVNPDNPADGDATRPSKTEGFIRSV